MTTATTSTAATGTDTTETVSVFKTDVATNEDQSDNDPYDYGNFKLHFASILMIFLSIAF